MNGGRRYDGEVLELLAVIRVAQQAGFTVAEIRTLLHGFSLDTPPSARWWALASRKLPEVEALVQRALGMKHLLERGLRCDCLRLEDCALAAARSSAQTIARERKNRAALRHDGEGSRLAEAQLAVGNKSERAPTTPVVPQ